MRVLGGVIITFFAALSLGCGLKKPSSPNVLVIAVEGLGFDRVACQSESASGGIATLCQESVRFTHAYANSTNSLPNLTSVLTGLFPWEHGVRGQTQWLKPEVETLAESALKNGYRTALISGGLPVLSKSGLGQGFENFDDRIDLMSRPHFRPVENVIGRFLNWLDQEDPDSFFSVVHLSDLLFPFELSETEEGEPRELSVSAHLEEMSEEIQRLIDVLKNENQWNRTAVVLVGLSGGRDASSLKSTQTQITLMIKPARLKRDQATSWGVDQNVAVTDIGVSLYEMINGKLPTLMDDRVSLSSVYATASPQWTNERYIITENYWSFENFGLDVVTSARRGSLLYVHRNPPALYNTLVDRQEQAPLPQSDSVYAQSYEAFKSFIDRELQPARPASPPDWFYVGVEGFRRNQWSGSGPAAAANPLKGWSLRRLIEQGDWAKIAAEFEHYPFVHYVALKKSKARAPKGRIRDLPCGRAFTANRLDEIDRLKENCDQERLLQYLDWAHYKNSNDNLYYENRFRRSFQYWWARLELGAMNYAAYGSLGVPLSWPLPPDVSELFLLSQERKPQRRALMEGFTSEGKY